MIFNVRVAKTAGFCFGVHRAIDRVLKLVNTSNQPIRTYGPLIHNEHVLKVLKSRGIQELDNTNSMDNVTVVIRAHGVSPDIQTQLYKNYASVCNATCPKVAQVQGIVKKYANQGYSIVIIGDSGHAEVEGLLGFAGGKGFVVSGPEDAWNIPRGEDICVVAQTTQNRKIFQQTIEYLQSQAGECHVFDTICDATSARQEETVKLAEKSDLMIIVGGKNSANTQRLFDIASSKCRSILVQSPDELKLEDFHDCKNIGITSGASTPAWIIRQVVNRIRELGWEKSNIVTRYLWKSIRYLYYKHILLPVAVALIAIGFCKVLHWEISAASVYFSLWFTWVWALQHSRLQCEYNLIKKTHSEFSDRLQSNLAIWIPVCAFVQLFLSVFYDGLRAALVMCLIVGVSWLLHKMQADRVRKYDGQQNGFTLVFSNVILTGFLFAVPAIGYPLISEWIREHTFSIQGMYYFVFLALLFVVRMIIMDIRNHQVCLISGEKTISSIVGKRNSILFTHMLIAVWIVVGILPIAFVSVNISMLLLLLVPLYYSIYLVFHQTHLFFLNIVSDATLDAGIYMLSVLVWFSLFVSKIV